MINDIEATLQPLHDRAHNHAHNRVHILSQERMLYLQLLLAPEYSFTFFNICSRITLFIYHAVKLSEGILIIAWEQELPWAFTISIYSVLELLLMIAGAYIWKHASRQAAPESSIYLELFESHSAFVNYEMIWKVLFWLSVYLAQFWWALGILTTNNAFGARGDAFGIIFYFWLFETLHLVPVQLILLLIAISIIVHKIRGRGGENTVAQQRLDLNNIQVFSYSNSLPGNHECAICQVDYVEGDNIMQLPCNGAHYYHEECLRIWLRVRRICPLCRTTIPTTFVV